MGQRVYELVDGQFLDLCIVQTDTQVGRKVEFAGQIAQYALEECVDGFYAEVAVVVK